MLNGVNGETRGRRILPTTLPGAVAKSEKADHLPEEMKEDGKDKAQYLKDEGKEEAKSAKSELTDAAEGVGDEISSWFS